MRNKMVKSFCGSLAAMAFGGVLLASAHSAAYTVPGITCKRISGGTYTPWFGTVKNSSTSSDMFVHCPLVNGNDMVLNSGNITVFDRSNESDVSCSLYAEYINGSNVVRQGITRSSSGFSSSQQELVYNWSYNGNSHYAECTIPKVDDGQSSHVNRIIVGE